MTKTQFSILVTVIVLCAVVLAFAQSYGGIGFAPIAPAVSNCPAGVTNGAMLCAVGTTSANYAMYVSYNAGAYQLLAGSAAGVTSFNGRTGAVTLTKSDVTATNLTATTSVTATTTLQ